MVLLSIGLVGLPGKVAKFCFFVQLSILGSELIRPQNSSFSISPLEVKKYKAMLRLFVEYLTQYQT